MNPYQIDIMGIFSIMKKYGGATLAFICLHIVLNETCLFRCEQISLALELVSY
jgi:hypothetical protein